MRCALTDASGNFELRGFRSGGYVARAVPTDPEYLPTEVVPIQLAVSEVKQFAPVLNRKGRLVVTVSAPDDVTGSVGLANGVTVEIVPYDPALPVPPDFPTPPLQTKVTGADPLLDNQAGTVMFTGLPDGRYDIRVSGGPRNLAGRAQSTPVGINQETPAAVIAAPTYPAVVGRVMTVVDGVVQPLANATVRLSGTVTVGTSNGLLPGSAMLTTDANGCYAVVSTADADAVPTSAECPAGVSGPARGGMVYRIELFGLVFEFAANLAVRTVDVVVTDQTIPPRTQPFQAVGLVAAEPPQPGGSYTIGTLTIAAQPVALGSWAVRDRFRPARSGRHRRRRDRDPATGGVGQRDGDPPRQRSPVGQGRPARCRGCADPGPVPAARGRTGLPGRRTPTCGAGSASPAGCCRSAPSTRPARRPRRSHRVTRTH